MIPTHLDLTLLICCFHKLLGLISKEENSGIRSMGGPKKALQRERDGPHSKALTGIAQKKKKPVPTSAISYPCTGGGGQSINKFEGIVR